MEEVIFNEWPNKQHRCCFVGGEEACSAKGEGEGSAVSFEFFSSLNFF